jgi:hypothetical protein
MDNVWTWSGTYFGYIERNNLWTHEGKHVGVINDDEIYGRDGRYLGEIRNENRLITKVANKGRTKSGFTPLSNRSATIPYVGYVGYVMYIGYEDFPEPSMFK